MTNHPGRTACRGRSQPNGGRPNRAVAGPIPISPERRRSATQGRRGGQRGSGAKLPTQQQAGQGQDAVAMDQEQPGPGQQRTACGSGRPRRTRRYGAESGARGNRGGRGTRNAQGDPAGGGNDVATDGPWQTTGPGPFTGEDYRQWSDQLRDVEEMLPQQDLRDRVAEVRDSPRDAGGVQTSRQRAAVGPGQQDIMGPWPSCGRESAIDWPNSSRRTSWSPSTAIRCRTVSPRWCGVLRESGG